MKAIQVATTGGPEVLKYTDVEAPLPSHNQVLVKVAVAGVNYIDTYYREGIYHESTPFIIGQEGAGVVIDDASGTFAPGTRVAWMDGFGSYAEFAVVNKDHLVEVPDSIDFRTAASMLLQGITANYLVDGVCHLSKGDSCLITAGAGGVGLLVTQFARSRGARVYSVVSNDEKAELSKEAGATEVFRYSDNLAEQVRHANGDQGVDVVYDGVGKATFAESLQAVRPRGLLCLFGAASGPVEPFDPQLLNKHGSLFLTRPSIGAYTADANEFRKRAHAVVSGVEDGTLNIRVGASYPLADATQAHQDLQDRKTTGSVVLTVDESL